MKVAVTGIGIISALGRAPGENLQMLLQGKTGIGRLQYLDTRYRDIQLFGEVKYSDAELASLLSLTDGHDYTRTALLGTYAAREAMLHAGINNITDHPTALVSSTSVGGMDKTEQYFCSLETDAAVRKYIHTHHPGDSTHKIAGYVQHRGITTTVSTACSSASNAIMLGARLILSGRVERAIVGGCDALCRFTVNGFNTLMIHTDGYNTPFDQERKGLNLGEGAAYLLLESEKIVQEQKKKVLARLIGFGNANDAFHQTASSEEGEGAYLAMQKALSMAGILPEQVDYINAHGTATPNNDLSEGRAIQRIFKDRVPEFSSTKPYTGHTLAAAGAIEAVFSILSLQHGVVFPNMNFRTPMEELYIRPHTSLQYKTVHTVLSNSFGFGGNCSSLIFSA